MKVWAKVKNNGDYHSHNIAQAVYGFRELGAEIVKYETTDQIMQLVTNEDIVLDYMNQVNSVFAKFDIYPDHLDYPQILNNFYGREIWIDNINSINSNPDKWGIFVKPLKEKAFTGRVVNKPADFIGCGSCYENYEVYCSKPLDFKREWRGFVRYDELIDISPYKGDYHYCCDPGVIDNVMAAFNEWEARPFGCSIDFAVVEDEKGNQKTIVVEVNDAYALGCYGLYHLDYAKLISARWSQLFKREDEFKF